MAGLQTKNPWKLFAFAGVGSCVAETATCPIDVVKVRMQLQGELGAARQYSSVANAVPTIVRSEGARGLFKGLQPALLRQATYGSIRMGIYEPIKAAFNGLAVDHAGHDPRRPPPLWSKAAAGMSAGALSSALCTPTDVVKVRMQADGIGRSASDPGFKPRYRNVFHAFRAIFGAEGLRGLYSGVAPTVQRAAVVAAVELATYDECKQLLVPRTGDGVATHFGASLMAGFMATLASSPCDVVKSRVMNQPVCADTGRGLRYASTWDCLRQSVRAEGVASLWKGFWPNFGRIGPHCIILFMTVEQLRKFDRLYWDPTSPTDLG